MRTIHTDEITKCIKEMCMQVNVDLSPDVKDALLAGKEKEESTIGKQILEQLEKNLEIAKESQIPICQDTGMTVVFLRIGQEVHIDGDFLEDAVNEGIRQGYAEGYLRKSVVSDPILRENTKDNTPGVIHYVKQVVIQAVKDAGPNACPPMVIGVGIGGTFEKCALLAKKALTRELGSHSEIPYVKDFEIEVLDAINNLGIGPGGLGGRVTAIGLNVETYPTHIAGLPVAVNICCHVNRHITRVL